MPSAKLSLEIRMVEMNLGAASQLPCKGSWLVFGQVHNEANKSSAVYRLAISSFCSRFWSFAFVSPYLT